MKTFIICLMTLVIVLFSGSCKKEKEKDFNTLKITEGKFSGYSHTFVPSMGFWSPVSEGVKYTHLVLGDDDNMATAGENVMSILFYHTGNPQVQFPSAEGQWVNFGINFNGTVYYFGAQDAVLAILYFDDTKFEGVLSGTFVNLDNSSETIDFTMDLSLMMLQI